MQLTLAEDPSPSSPPPAYTAVVHWPSQYSATDTSIASTRPYTQPTNRHTPVSGKWWEEKEVKEEDNSISWNRPGINLDNVPTRRRYMENMLGSENLWENEEEVKEEEDDYWTDIDDVLIMEARLLGAQYRMLVRGDARENHLAALDSIVNGYFGLPPRVSYHR